jgi:hypothetical protein
VQHHLQFPNSASLSATQAQNVSPVPPPATPVTPETAAAIKQNTRMRNYKHQRDKHIYKLRAKEPKKKVAERA